VVKGEGERMEGMLSQILKPGQVPQPLSERENGGDGLPKAD